MTMPTELWAVGAAVAASALAALATFELKRGAAETRLALAGFQMSGRVPLAVLLYVASSLFFLAALRGAQLSVVLPVTTLEYVWILLLARWVLRERIGRGRAAGIACIALGLILVGLGS
jgi:drug/metabolite transporter (DMT)-like permease